MGPITGGMFFTRDNSFGPARNRTTIPRTSISYCGRYQTDGPTPATILQAHRIASVPYEMFIFLQENQMSPVHKRHEHKLPFSS